MGESYYNTGEYSKDLSNYLKACEITESVLSDNNPDLANIYSNIGSVLRVLEEKSKALSYYEKAYEIYQETSTPNQATLAGFYRNFGLLYINLVDYTKALSFQEKALDIKQKILPSDHPDIADS
ncbi:unnamed protein product [Rotaria sp. Silwood2]|nr:unnamed protein product [Rotaria sp. Silwood2]CAF4497661.1 unnamed protein product [Rotaria sp. Silwood2]